MAAAEPLSFQVDDQRAYSIDDSFLEVINLMERGCAESVYPGCVVLVAQRGEVLFEHATGVRWLRGSSQPADDNAMRLDTVFDIASLTGVVVTATLIMRLVESGRVKLEDRVSKFLTGFGVHGKSDITIAHLLTHTSGLPAWHPFCEELLQLNAGARLGILASRGARDYVYNELRRIEPRYAVGSREMYSDLGFLLLGEVIEAVEGVRLDGSFSRHILSPLRLSRSGFIDLALLRRRAVEPDYSAIAPTENCPWRGHTLCGEVHDDNAWAMGGVAGHSGLFSSAGDLTRFAQQMCAAHAGTSQFISSHTVRRFWTAGLPGKRGAYRCGWESPHAENGMGDTGISADAVGHNSFTGCSLWIDPERQISIVVMTNRVHPSRNNKKIGGWRTEFHRAAVAALSSR